MAENTFICNESLSKEAILTIECGIETVRYADYERYDRHMDYLRILSSLTVHAEGCKNYRKKLNIQLYKK